MMSFPCSTVRPTQTWIMPFPFECFASVFILSSKPNPKKTSAPIQQLAPTSTYHLNVLVSRLRFSALFAVLTALASLLCFSVALFEIPFFSPSILSLLKTKNPKEGNHTLMSPAVFFLFYLLHAAYEFLKISGLL